MHVVLEGTQEISKKILEEDDPSMEDFPREILVEILSRLPVKSIIQCKSVCKKWRNIVSDSHFADIHLSRSPAGIVVHHKPEIQSGDDFLKPGILKLVEVEDDPDHHHLQHDPVMSLNLNLSPIFQESNLLMVDSVNGLICLLDLGYKRDKTYICNPITREYMILPRPKHYGEDSYDTVAYGFGVCSVKKEYKVIRIFQGDKSYGSRPRLVEAEVYTLGSGEWRNLGHVPYWLDNSRGPFLNGHAYWIVEDEYMICAFNFDKETFRVFPSPYEEESAVHFKSLGVLRGCLCNCDVEESEGDWCKVTLWVMKEIGIKKSWEKELVIERSLVKNPELMFLEHLYLLAGLKDGSILVESYQEKLLVYCPLVNAIVDTNICNRYLNGLAYRPSFLRLHHFQNETVRLF